MGKNKKIIVIWCGIALLYVTIIAAKPSTNEMLQIADYFVTSLYSDVESYGMLSKYEKYTKDGVYQIKPIGRLVNVKIMKVADDNEYEHLRRLIKNHYKNDNRVRQVYRIRSGTIMIDCRRQE